MEESLKSLHKHLLELGDCNELVFFLSVEDQLLELSPKDLFKFSSKLEPDGEFFITKINYLLKTVDDYKKPSDFFCYLTLNQKQTYIVIEDLIKKDLKMMAFLDKECYPEFSKLYLKFTGRIIPPAINWTK